MIPKKVKHRKWHNPKTYKWSKVASRKTTVAYGDFALKSLDSKWITSRQLEAARRAMTRFVQRGGKIWIRVFTQRPVTDKGGEMKMGKGKGPVDHYMGIVNPGTIIFEMAGVPENEAREAMRLAAHKLPVRTKFIRKA